MRLSVLRPAPLLIALVATVFLHVALGSLLACFATPEDRSVVLVAAEEPRIDSRADPAPQPLCTPPRPCQHTPQDGRDGGAVVVRGSGVLRAGDPCLQAVCSAVPPAGPAAAGPSVSNPVPPLAVRAPVAVLGVDRS